MYSVMLVDDELQVHKGLSKYVKWSDYGFVVKQSAKSMTEALEKLSQDSFDLVITDIMMPGGSGLELLEEIRVLDKDLCVGILSAYGEFDYAKRAIKNGALSYLMKPVDFDEFHGFLREVKQILDKRKQSTRKYDEFLEEKSILSMVKNEVVEVQEEVAFVYPWLYEENEKILARVQCVGKISSQEKKRFIKQWDDFLEEYVSVTIKKSSNEYLTVLKVNKTNVVELIKDYNINKNWIIGLSSIIETNYNLAHLYEEASKALYFHGVYRSQVVLYENTKKNLLVGEDLEPVFKEKLERDLSIGAHRSFVDRLVKEYNKKVEMGYREDFMIRFMVQISFLLRCYFIEHQHYTKMQEIIHKMTQNIVMCNCNDRILSQSIQSINEIFDLCKSSNSINIIIEKAKSYINKYYADEITLEIVASNIYIHPIYLSRLFKEETGENFSTFLIRTRLNKAKELLKDEDLKVYQISEMVGYENPKYFSRVFRSNVGCSPSKYRRTLK